MLQINWGDLTPEKFLNEYWQKKPLLIKNAFTDFIDPISADELAGLAMEQEIESRIISHHEKEKWQVAHGPFEAFDSFGETGWTLLVQAVNNWSGETGELLSPFTFLPNWRIDDVMVSFSTPTGGVGAHLDQYDVFIVQGEGKRRWQVGLPDNTLQALLPHPDLKQVSEFIPFIDEITEPGDLLYIPPNHPHNGIAIENSLNFSIGFQAPNNQELWSSYTDKLIDEDRGEQRFSDKNRSLTHNPEVLTTSDINEVKDFMLNMLAKDKSFSQFLGCHLTQCHHALELLIPVTPFEPAKISEYFDVAGNTLTPVSGIKALYNEEDNNVYINGELFQLCSETQSLGQLLGKNAALTAESLKSFIDCLKNAQLLTSVLNKGFWFIE